MSDTLSAKDPAEIVPISFEFASLTAEPTNAAVTVTRHSGPKGPADLSAMLAGSPQVIGTQVRQKIQGGTIDTVYKIRCQVDGPDGTRYVLTGLLPVATA